MKRILACALLLLLVRCGAGLPEVPVRRVALVYAASDAFPSEAAIVVRDVDSLRKLWAQMDPKIPPIPPFPTVDFTKEMLLVAATGTRDDEGYWAWVDHATALDDTLTPDVIFTSPGSDCSPAPVRTSRVYLASVPRYGQVVFRINRVVQYCGCLPGTLFCDG